MSDRTCAARCGVDEHGGTDRADALDDREGEGVAVVAQRKFAPKPTAAELQQMDRVMRARRANPPRDPDGSCHEEIAAIARETGRDVADMLDIWDERAAIRQYDGETDRYEAERLAVEDVRQLFAPRLL